MNERRVNGHTCFNCENKYIKGHTCGEKKLFYVDCKVEEDQSLESSQYLDLKVCTTPVTSCHALENISMPKTLAIEGYIKNSKR